MPRYLLGSAESDTVALAMKRVRIPRYLSGSGVPRSEAVEVTSPIPLDLVGSIVFRLGVKSCPTAGLVVSATFG